MVGTPSIRRPQLCWSLACALALGAAPALGAEAPKSSKTPKIAVLEIKATGNSDPKAATALSSLIASEAQRFPVKVVAGSDLQTLIGFDKQKKLLGCSDGSCLAEIGGALGVDYLLGSEIGEFGGRWLLTLTLLDITKACPVQRVTRQAKSQSELVDAVGPAVADVLVLFAKPDAPKVAAARPANAEAPKPSAPVEVTSASQPTGSGKTAGLALVGVGGALLAGGAVVGILAKLQHDDTRSSLASATPEALDAAKGAITMKMRIADALYAGGAIAAAVGLGLVLTAPSGDSPAATLQLLPVSSGGALVVSGGF